MAYCLWLQNYIDENLTNGVIRTLLFAVAWLVALLCGLTAASPDGDLDQYNDPRDFDYATSMASFAIIQGVGFGIDLILYFMSNRVLDLFREVVILATASTGLVGFTAGMVKLGGQHSVQADHPVEFNTSVAAYAYLASAVLGFVRILNIVDKSEDDQNQILDTRIDTRKEQDAQVGVRYNRVPRVEDAHNFYA